MERNVKCSADADSLFLDSDIEDSLVMEQMGHSDIATPRRYYYYSIKSEKNKPEYLCILASRVGLLLTVSTS